MKDSYCFLSVLLCFLIGCSNPTASNEKVQQNQHTANPGLLSESLPTSQQAEKRDANYALNRIVILSGQASMLIPVGFTLMDAEIVSLKYPAVGHRPSAVYTNKEGTINIAVNHTQNRARAKDLPEVKKAMEAQFNRPPIAFIGSDMAQVNGQECIIMAFVSPATDTKIYNLMLMTSLDDRLAMITFNCTENYRGEWESRGKEILQSIKVKH